MMRRILLAAGLVVWAAACGGPMSPPGALVTTTSAPAEATFLITIQAATVSPADLHVPPGATVTVVNMDATPRSVTSEAAAASFTPGAVAGVAFDTGEFSLGARSFTIAPGAPNGTVVPYFCGSQMSTMDMMGMMAAPEGQITIDASAPVPAPMAVPMPMMMGGG